MRRGTGLTLLLGAALALGFAVLRLADPAPVRDLRLQGFDYLVRLSPRPAPDLKIRIIDIDETSLAALGQWPWPRDILADLVDRLAAAGAAVVALDVLFAEPGRLRAGATERPDASLALSLESAPTVVGTARGVDPVDTGPQPRAGLVEVGAGLSAALPRAPSFTPVVPDLAAAATGVGVISVGPGSGSGPVRRLPLLWSGPSGILPALSLEAVRVAAGETTVTLWGAPGADGVVEGIGLGEVFLPTDADGEMWLWPRRDTPDTYLAALDVLTRPEAEWAGRVNGHIVLVGTSAAGLLDIQTTALGEAVPGVSIHAQAIEQMLSGAHLVRSDSTAGFELVTILALILAIALATAFAGPALAVGIGAVGAASLLGAAWGLFQRGTLFDAAFPLVAAGLSFALLVALRLIVVDRERRLVRRSLSHYVAPEVLGEIERSDHQIALGGEARDVTVLFSDLRGFTQLSETLPPEDLVTLLNTMFEAFSEEIMAERGTIDKFIGDAVMAFWNAPLPVADHPMRATAAALRMRAALTQLNRSGGPPLRTAIGLATGPAFVGNIGSRKRFNYSVIGETVNLAARVEAACRPIGADILVTADVAAATPELALLDAGCPVLRGIGARVPLLAVVGDHALAETGGFAALVEQHDALIAHLAAGKPLRTEAVENAARAANALLPGLGAFFEALPMRAGDYASGGSGGAPPAKRFSRV